MSFRTRLLLAMMLVVASITALGLHLARRNLSAQSQRDLRQDFEAQLTLQNRLEESRRTALVEACRRLVEKPRLHAALEDNALDLLYPSARDELRDLMRSREKSGSEVTQAPRAEFYRFLDRGGALIRPGNQAEAGSLSPAEEVQLKLTSLPSETMSGFVWRDDGNVNEVIAIPITSSENGEVISALEVGAPLLESPARSAMQSGLWSRGRMLLPGADQQTRARLEKEFETRLPQIGSAQNSFLVSFNGTNHLVFAKQSNPNSNFSAAYEVRVYSLANFDARERKLRAGIFLAGLVLMALAFVASDLAARRLARPVEALEVEAVRTRSERDETRARLVSTKEELQRVERFSADASHQLKSPVTVLRAGLETLMQRDDFSPEVYDELSALVHQTYRLTGIVDDLLLLAQIDAGQLRIDFQPVDFSRLVLEWVEDFGAINDESTITIEEKISPGLCVSGDWRYISLIAQNLFENALKYNRAAGRIRVAAHREDGFVYLCVGNTGAGIAADARGRIFERFHRAGAGENVSGHGLGLNLARDLARLHGGDLVLARSDNDWTEFEVRFCAVDGNAR